MYNNKDAMADRHAEMMREFSSSSGLTLEDDDQSTQGDYGDIAERDPNFIEERFRVDRKKLEQMLQGKIQLCSDILTLAKPTVHVQ